MQAGNMTLTSFLILSDTHNITSSDIPLTRLPKVDVVLHCGDLTEHGTLDELEDAVEVLGRIDAEVKLVIAGNHDIVLDREYYLSQGGNVKEHLKATALLRGAATKGIYYLEEGRHTFSTNAGANFTVYATPYTPRYGLSAFQYPSAEDRYNAASNDPERPSYAVEAGCLLQSNRSIIQANAIDIIMSHGPPKYILDGTTNGVAGGCEHLRRAICRAKPQLHAFGHVHNGYGVQRVEWQSNTGGEEDWEVMSAEFIGKNATARKGYARLPFTHEDDLREANQRHKEIVARGQGGWGFPQTAFVNAAIMDENGMPENYPWVVELDL